MFVWWQGTEIKGSFTLLLNVPSVKLPPSAFENLPIVATSKANCLFLGNSDCTHFINFNWQQHSARNMSLIT